MQERLSDARTEFKLGRIPRQKFRLSRARVLESAVKVMETYATQRSILEVQFYGEVGTGLGPTLEFYTLVSQELQRRDLNLWRHDPFKPTQDVEANPRSESDARRELKPKNPERLWSPAIEVSKIADFHRIAVLLCAGCHALKFARCDRHAELLTVETVDGKAQCSRCETSAKAEQCTACDMQMVLEWWVICDEEAEYQIKAFTRDADTMEHVILQCPRCSSINFPGTNMSLVTSVNGEMYSVSGRRMFEKDYRAVTRHLSSTCENTALKEIPVVLDRAECTALAQFALTTPEALEDSSSSETIPTREHVVNPNGLFPCPFFDTEDERTQVQKKHLVKYFTFIGRLLAKAAQDGRQLDLPLSNSFYKLLNGQPLTPFDMHFIDPALDQSLSKLEELCLRKSTMTAEQVLTRHEDDSSQRLACAPLACTNSTASVGVRRRRA